MKVMICESWPLNIDFTAAVQNPQICFQDQQLRRSQPAKNRRGRVLLWSGNFATVYKLDQQEQSWAVRCFTRAPQIDVQERYNRIANHLSQHHLPYLVDFEFIDNGILVRGQWYPILKMDWVDGKELDLYIGAHINDADKLLVLDQKIKQLKADLRSVGIAHGDLQHGNIMVTEAGDLKLVDYDGMYVPALAGNPPIETGHPNYQPPARSPDDFGETVDEFSFDVISLSLHALAQQPQLWESFHEDNKNLIFRQDDFKEPEASPVFQSIAAIEDPTTKLLRSQLIRRCRGDIVVAESEEILPPFKLVVQYLQSITLKSKSKSKDKDKFSWANLPRSQWLMLTAVVGLTLGLTALVGTVVVSSINRGRSTTSQNQNTSNSSNSANNANSDPVSSTNTADNSATSANEPEIVLIPITAAELISAYDAGERDFANVDLRGENLSGTVLDQIDLRNALLTETDLSNTRLGGANLTGAIATGADFRGVDLAGADLTEANLSTAIMSQANLTGARLLRADLSQADLNFAVLRGAELMRASFANADLSLADLSAANLLLADLHNTNLLKANLRESNLSATNLDSARLEGADLLLADLRSANLNLANLNYADLREADLSSADLTQANLIGANLSGANLRGTDVNKLASIEGADFTDVANLSSTTKTYFCAIADGQTFANSPAERKATRATLDCPN